METITVTIGRNVGADPLPSDRWNAFTADTRKAVEAVTVELWAVAPYKGSWEGRTEDAAIFYGPLVAADESFLTALRQRLATLATYYGQQAIGLSVGTGELVEHFATETPAVLEGVG